MEGLVKLDIDCMLKLRNILKLRSEGQMEFKLNEVVYWYRNGSVMV